MYAQLGIDVQSGSEGKGEAAALSAGFDMLFEYLDWMFAECFVQTADDMGLELFLSLMDERKTTDKQADRLAVISRFSKCRDYIGYNDFIEALKKVSPEAECVIGKAKITLLHFVSADSPEKLIRAGRFIKEYVPVFCMVSFGGSGIAFNAFDLLDMPWFQLDEVNLPFYLLDELN